MTDTVTNTSAGADMHSDADKAAAIVECLRRIEALTTREMLSFERQCVQTRATRAAAASVLGTLLETHGVAFSALRTALPETTVLVNQVLTHSLPVRGLSTMQRTAIADTCVAVLCKELLDQSGSQLYSTLTEPVRQTIGDDWM